MGENYLTGAAIEPPLKDEDADGRETFGIGSGECPDCGRRAGPFIIGPDYWFVCDDHRVCWCVGSKLTDDWKRPGQKLAQEATLTSIRDYKVVPAAAAVLTGEKAAHARLRAARGKVADPRPNPMPALAPESVYAKRGGAS
jgi:hypothetical protein